MCFLWRKRKWAILCSLCLSGVLVAEANKPMRAGPAGFDQPLVRNRQLTLPGERWNLQLPRNRFVLQGNEAGAMAGPRGIRVEIMPDSFQLASASAREKVEIEWIEVLEPIDYLLAGIPLIAKESTGLVALTSGGMVRLKLSHPLKPGKSIRLLFPDIFPNQPFHAYRLTNSFWLNIGPVEQERDMSDNEAEQTTYRVLRAFGGGWLNLDYPEPEVTCVKLSVQGAPSDEYLTVVALGIDHRSYFTVSGRCGEDIRINTFRNKDIKVVVLGNKTAGATAVLRSPARPGHMNDFSSGVDTCTAIQPVMLKLLNEEQKKDPARLAEFLGL